MKFPNLILILFAISSCASGPNDYPPLEETTIKLEKLKNSENAYEIDSGTFYQIQENIDKAKLTLQNNKISDTDHYLYIANKKIEVANEKILKNQYQEELIKLESQQDELIAQAHRVKLYHQHEAQPKQYRVKKHDNELNLFQLDETNRGTMLIINDLLFVTGGTSVQPESYEKLEPLLNYLQNNPKRDIIIEGHTGSDGNADENNRLSQNHAGAVKQYLVNHGIDGERIEIRGFGDEVPVASNTTNAGRSLNSRIEIVIKSRPIDKI